MSANSQQGNNGAHQSDNEDQKLLKGIGVTELRDEVCRLRQDAIDFSEKLEHLLKKADFNVDPTNYLFKTYHDDAKMHRERRQKLGGALPEREFVMQNSPLTDLFKSKHFQSLESAFISALLLWAFTSALSDFLEKGTIFALLPNLGLVESAFENSMPAVLVWLKLFAMALAIFPITQFWAMRRTPGSEITNFDRFFFFVYILYQTVFLLVPFRILFYEPILGRGCATAISMEHCRLMMKMHSFVREITKRFIVDPSKKDDGDQSPPPSPTSKSPALPRFPDFSKYLYFLFAPTLIYRDTYPRNPTTDWYYVFSNVAQFCACCMLIYYMFERFVTPKFAAYPPKKLTFALIMQASSGCILPGTACMLMCFFGLLHSWLNAWAEMLRFGDRLFYKDWWNVSTYPDFYRTWNCVVHDWLHTYLYKETAERFKSKNNRKMSLFLVFFFSILFHEYIATAMLKCFFPLLAFNFGVFGSVFFKFITSKGRIFNTLLWAGVTLGVSLMVSMYSFEIAARDQCPPAYENAFLNAIVPRFWTCMQK